MTEPREGFFAACPRGLEQVLAQEIAEIGGENIVAGYAGCAFEGPITLCYRVNLQSRIASRVLWRVGAAHYKNEHDIYQAAHALPWPDWFDARRTLMVEVSARRCPLKSLDFVTLRIKDAVCDRFRDVHGTRPNVDTREPDVRIFAFLDERDATFYLDTSGAALFKRGYRDARVDAPLKENLAAGILRLTGWRGEDALCDPMCGSGTLVIEAALIAANRAPGARRGFAFEKLGNFSASHWRKISENALAAERASKDIAIFASDKFGKALETARHNARNAGIADMIRFTQADVLEVRAPANSGVLVSNPPYGVRMGDDKTLETFYPRLGDALKQRFAGWRAFLFSADKRLAELIRLKASRRTPLYNGALECRLYEYVIISGSMRPERKQESAAQFDSESRK
jgi:putative N6-adenine-specific DNA methylase